MLENSMFKLANKHLSLSLHFPHADVLLILRVHTMKRPLVYLHAYDYIFMLGGSFVCISHEL